MQPKSKKRKYLRITLVLRMAAAAVKAGLTTAMMMAVFSLQQQLYQSQIENPTEIVIAVLFVTVASVGVITSVIVLLLTYYTTYIFYCYFCLTKRGYWYRILGTPLLCGPPVQVNILSAGQYQNSSLAWLVGNVVEWTYTHTLSSLLLCTQLSICTSVCIHQLWCVSLHGPFSFSYTLFSFTETLTPLSINFHPYSPALLSISCLL